MITKKEKRIKRRNGLENLAYSVRAKLYIMLKVYPSYRKGFKKLDRLGKRYPQRRKLTGMDFNPKKRTQWGSAIPETCCVFQEENVIRSNSGITILTRLEDAVGRNWKGKYIKDRNITSGTCAITGRLLAAGVFSGLCCFEGDTVGSWDSFWTIGEDKSLYREFDGIERFFSTPEENNALTTSVHKGESPTEGRELYSNGYRIPKRMRKVHCIMEFRDNTMRCYINGMLVFVGRQWQIIGPISLVVGSGVKPSYKEEAVKGLSKGQYRFTVTKIERLMP